MKIRVWLVSGIVFGALGMAFASVPAQAKNKTVKECTAEWKAAEAAKTTGGKKRADFITACRQEEAAAPAAAAPAEPAPAPKPMAQKPPMAAPARPMQTPDSVHRFVEIQQRKARQGAHGNMARQWKANKANNANGGMKWIQKFWQAATTANATSTLRVRDDASAAAPITARQLSLL